MQKSQPLEFITHETDAPVDACVIWLHGLGADGHDFAGIIHQLQLPENLGIRFIFPHAPKRPVTLNNGFVMRAWYDIYSLNDLNEQDRAGILSSEAAILQLIQQQLMAGIAATRIILAGFSQGGALALHTGLRFSSPLGGILGLSTYLPLSKQFDNQQLANREMPVFLAHGRLDDILPLSLGEMTRDLLQKLG
ncbi:MAG: alpha/beta fold hydrolase, partial [Proteobacteria bacterium]|nr:alpha/beta fold hydrolase [Pseudomonadota bacterium]